MSEVFMAELLLLLVVLVVSLLFGSVGASMARSRAKDPSVWFLICALTPVIGVVALAQSPKVASAETGELGVPRFDADSDSVPEVIEMTEEEGSDPARVAWMISKGIVPR
jgi:hypothetical protein